MKNKKSKPFNDLDSHKFNICQKGWDMKGVSMCQALMEIMEPQLLLREKEGRIEGTVDTMRDFGREDAEIKKTLMQKYSLSEKEAEMYL